MLLQNRTIIVTGAARGLGEGIARVCHREGAAVVLADILAGPVQQVAASLGDRALAIHCDLTDDAQLANLIAASLAAFGRIDGLVNNAGINFSKPFLEITPEDWQHVIAIDLRAAYFLTQMVCRQMLRQSPAGGSIVNISSVHSTAAHPCCSLYDNAKWGMVGFSKSAAVELASSGIRVNIVSPGLVNTQLWRDVLDSSSDPDRCWNHWKGNIPIQRTIEPAEIGELTAFLLSDRASCITGSNIIADGGMTSLLVNQPDYEIKPPAPSQSRRSQP